MIQNILQLIIIHFFTVGDNIDTQCNRNITNESESVVQINNFQTLPTSIKAVHSDDLMNKLIR